MLNSSLTVDVFQGLSVTLFFKNVLCGVEQYVKSGRDQMVILIRTKFTPKEKKSIMNVMSCTPSSSPSMKYPSDGWGKSLQRMPSFTRIEYFTLGDDKGVQLIIFRKL